MPWWAGAAIALSLLLLPLLAWLVFPAAKMPGAGASTGNTALASPEEEEEDGEAPVDHDGPEGAHRLVSGNAVDETGNAVVGAKITVTSGGRSVGSATTGEDGAFSLSIPSGDASIAASHPTSGLAGEALAESGDIADLRLVLKNGGPVTGIVVDSDGKGVAESYIVCTTDAQLHATTDENGKFALPAEADGCGVTASHPENGSSATLVVTAGGKNRIELPSPGKISGMVVDDRGGPVAAFSISIDSYTTPEGERESTGFRQKRFDAPNGEFTLDGLAPGQYVLSASAEGHPPTKSKSIEVTGGSRARGVKITLSAGAAVSGIVTDRETGDPVEGARIRLDAMTGGAATSTTSDASGRYTLNGVPTDSFSIRVSHTDYKERIISLDASTTKTLRSDIDLGKKGEGGDMEMSGIGATLLQGPQYVEVATVLPGGPAEGGGVKVGDRIEAIDGKDASSFSVNDCIQRLRGAEGTRVTMSIGRGRSKLSITLTRARIER